MFSFFKASQFLLDHPEAVSVATKRTIAEFAQDNVRYLELRTTPRAVAGKMTAEEHIRTVAQAATAPPQGIVVKLLLSIDRRHSTDRAWETLEIYRKMQVEFPGLFVGLDLSGDAREGISFLSTPFSFKRLGQRYPIGTLLSASLDREVIKGLYRI